MIESSYLASPSTGICTIVSWVGIGGLGKRALLDGAVCSFALQVAGKQRSDQELVAQSWTIYGTTLNELQMALRHPTEWRASETLCAAMLLCFFELFAGTSAPDTWLQHAKGIGVLMEQRGPAAHAEGWDAAVLLSFRGILWILHAGRPIRVDLTQLYGYPWISYGNATLAGKKTNTIPCQIMGDMFYSGEGQFFLSRPEWKQVTSERGRYLIHPAGTPDDTIRVADSFFANLVEVTPVLKWGYIVREANKAGISVEPASPA
ncbi:hypothetical protein FZEAL_367 [Fusarium zealandicum]|uniref:Uncharacterized protein n=1 Tax=Fusarium zealandicum TaxID=1053134 RepID=A0A8H4UUY4_9HYPO|nr:hypothetical protein FZEAL_367 [Fusarium zealandicum]